MVNLGDLLCYATVDENETYGEVVGKRRTPDGDRTYDVYPLCPCDDEYWRYSEDYVTIDARDVRYRVRNARNYEVAWARMGFIMLGTAENGWRFLRHADASIHRAPTVSDSDDSDETDSGTESESLGSLQEFLVDTSDEESDHPGAEEANAAFDAWVPESPGERQFKDTIERLEARIKHRTRRRKDE